jgi:hypothetical protein
MYFTHQLLMRVNMESGETGSVEEKLCTLLLESIPAPAPGVKGEVAGPVAHSYVCMVQCLHSVYTCM